jgi:hypothetical protein
MIPEVAKEQGLSAQDVARQQAEFQGFVQGEKTLGTRQAQIDMTSTVLDQFVPLAKDASAAFKRSGIKSVNDLEIAIKSRTASPELRKAAAATNAVINAYGRAINPSGVGNERDKEEARKILDMAFATEDYDAAANQILMEIGAEKKAPGRVKKDMRESFGNKEPAAEAKPKGAVTPALLADYAKKHNMTSEAAATFLKGQGYAIQ